MIRRGNQPLDQQRCKPWHAEILVRIGAPLSAQTAGMRPMSSALGYWQPRKPCGRAQLLAPPQADAAPVLIDVAKTLAPGDRVAAAVQVLNPDSVQHRAGVAHEEPDQ